MSSSQELMFDALKPATFQCTMCGEEKLTSAFSPQNSTKDGRNHAPGCRDCNRIRTDIRKILNRASSLWQQITYLAHKQWVARRKVDFAEIGKKMSMPTDMLDKMMMDDDEFAYVINNLDQYPEQFGNKYDGLIDKAEIITAEPEPEPEPEPGEIDRLLTLYSTKVRELDVLVEELAEIKRKIKSCQ